MLSCMPITGARGAGTVDIMLRSRDRWRRLTALIVAVLVAVTMAACSQFKPRDKRFYCRALWNFELREDLAELDSEFNGVDFGHSNLYENLLFTGGRDVPAIEERARKETLAFIASKPRLNPNEEAIAPTYMKLAWRAQNTFDEAHALHRATYDIMVSDEPNKDEALRRVLAYCQNSAYAITVKRLDHHRDVSHAVPALQFHDLGVPLSASGRVRSAAGGARSG